MPDDALPAERKVLERLGHLPLDFRAMGVVSNLFRASTAIRRHMESTILAADKLSWTSFVALWVLWVWGEMESRDLAAAVGISRPTSTVSSRRSSDVAGSNGAAPPTTVGWSASR